MGKRKFKEEAAEEAGEEETQNVSTEAAAAATQFREPRLKRIKREHHQQQQQEEGEPHHQHQAAPAGVALVNGSTTTTPVRRRRHAGGADMVADEDSCGTSSSSSEKTAVWLIRKPVNVPIEALNNIHFSRKSNFQCQKFSPTSSAGAAGGRPHTVVECHLKKPNTPMLHVISDRKRNFDEKVPMTQGPRLRGVVWVNNIELQQATTGAEEEHNELLQLDGDNDDGDLVPSAIQIGSIRRKPVVDEQMLRERLKAFGTEPTSGGAATKKTRRK